MYVFVCDLAIESVLKLENEKERGLKFGKQISSIAKTIKITGNDITNTALAHSSKLSFTHFDIYHEK